MNSFTIYKSLPIWLQNVLVNIKGQMLQRERYGGCYRRVYDALCRSEHWSARQIEAYKTEQLKRILTYAYAHCPYYKRKFDEAGVAPADFNVLADLQKFPILTKAEVREHWHEMLSDEADRKSLLLYHTSGSTGTPLNFYWTRESLQYYWAVVWRGRRRVGVHRGDLHLNFTGKLVVPLGQSKPPYWRYNKALNQYMLNMQHISPEKVADIVRFINDKHFKFFVGYPSIIYSLALLCNRMGLQITAAPKYIFTSAEKMYGHQRAMIEKVFRGSIVMEHYGFSEEAACACKCPHGMYHEDFEMGHLELYRPEHTERGLTGRMLATGFQNLGMPFIRYEIGDTATFSLQPCPCGLHSQTIVDIEGRNEDYILTSEGTRYTRLDYLLKDVSNVAETQIVQREKGKIVLRIVPLPGYSKEENESKIKALVREKFSATLQVGFEYVDSIGRTKAGKFKYIVNEMNTITPPN
jgi:phenylacetate-CoA ligase